MRRLFGLLVGFGPIVALAGTRASSEHVAHRAGNSAGHLDAFVVAHQDDWQLFMGDVAAQRVRSGERVVFVYVTAGDAGDSAAYWQHRMRGALASTGLLLGRLPPDGPDDLTAGREPLECADTTIDGRSVHRCRLQTTVSYFLELPDGNFGGEGFAVTGNHSLQRLLAAGGGVSPLAPLRGSGEYKTWGDVLETIGDIVSAEARAAGASGNGVHIHATDPDTAFKG